MRQSDSPQKDAKLIKHRNEIAALQSIIPGLGHIYKGHFGMGIMFMLLFPVFVYSGIVMALATAGFGLFLPITYMFAVGWHAYQLEDHRKHHLGWF